jgi:CBS-domain-containing membrane protein
MALYQVSYSHYDYHDRDFQFWLETDSWLLSTSPERITELIKELNTQCVQQAVKDIESEIVFHQGLVDDELKAIEVSKTLTADQKKYLPTIDEEKMLNGVRYQERQIARHRKLVDDLKSGKTGCDWRYTFEPYDPPEVLSEEDLKKRAEKK